MVDVGMGGAMVHKNISLAALLGSLLVSPLMFVQLPEVLTTPAVKLRKVASPQRRTRQVTEAGEHKPIQGAVHPKAPQPEPCWKVAGISPEAMDRRRSIEQETHSRVREICTDSSLTDEQKRKEIRAIRQAANQEILGLTTPDQRAALKQCNQERAAEHAAAYPVAHLPRAVPPNPHPAGPCGDMR